MEQDKLRKHVHDLLVRKIKTEKVVNQKQLAETCNVTEMTVSKWLRNDNPTFPAGDLIPSICKALKIDLSEFFDIGKTDTGRALKLYEQYVSHPEQQESVKKLLDIREL